LRGHLDPAVLHRARDLAAELSEPERTAVAEAACIAAALRAHEQNAPPQQKSAAFLHPHTTDLEGEAVWLAAVSQALAHGEADLKQS
jgi:hypothetical protein